METETPLITIPRRPDDNDDNSSDDFGGVDTGSSSDLTNEEKDRDEVKEIEKYLEKETGRVILMRWATTLAILATAMVVTFTTYRLLKNEQVNNFEEAVSSSSIVVYLF